MLSVLTANPFNKKTKVLWNHWVKKKHHLPSFLSSMFVFAGLVGLWVGRNIFPMNHGTHSLQPSEPWSVRWRLDQYLSSTKLLCLGLTTPPQAIKLYNCIQRKRSWECAAWPKRKPEPLPIICFQGRAVSFREGIVAFKNRLPMIAKSFDPFC